MNYSTLKELLTQKRINIPALAKEIGMSKPGLYLAIDKERLTVDNLEKIAKVLDAIHNVRHGQINPLDAEYLLKKDY